MKKHLIVVACLAIMMSMGMLVSEAHADSPSEAVSSGAYLTGWAWSSNIGWISLNSDNPNSGGCGSGCSYAVYVSSGPTAGGKTYPAGTFEGYAWSSNVGWLDFDPDVVENNCGADKYPRLSADGTVSGMAKVFSDHTCVELSGVNHVSSQNGGGVFVDSTGKFTGYAWHPDYMGWIDFSRACIEGGSNQAGCGGQTSEPDFTVSGDKTLVTISPGSSDTEHFTIAQSGSDVTDTQLVSVTIPPGSVPSGVHLIPAPDSCTINQSTPSCGVTVTVSADTSAEIGSWSFTLIGNNGSKQHSTSGAVTVANQAAQNSLSLSIYRTKSDGTVIGQKSSTSKQVPQNGYFALSWSGSLDDEHTNCSAVPSGPGNWSAWIDQFTTSPSSGNSGALSSNVPVGTYTFTATCSKNDDSDPVNSNPVKLQVTSINEGEL